MIAWSNFNANYHCPLEARDPIGGTKIFTHIKGNQDSIWLMLKIWYRYMGIGCMESFQEAQEVWAWEK